MKVYEHYLFDADGTLFDTTDLICKCFDYVAERFTKRKLQREAVMNSIGLPLKDTLVTHLGPGLDYEQILDVYLQYQLSIMEDSVTTFPGVVSTLRTLKEHGKKLAIVTSRRRFSLKVILRATDTAQYFDYLITPEDTALHKPHAAPAIKAMELLDSNRASTVFTGDAQYDICSGTSAGIDTVFVNWSHVDPCSLPVAPTWTIDSMSELTEVLP